VGHIHLLCNYPGSVSTCSLPNRIPAVPAILYKKEFIKPEIFKEGIDQLLNQSILEGRTLEKDVCICRVIN
jgi:hypothetical protein